MLTLSSILDSYKKLAMNLRFSLVRLERASSGCVARVSIKNLGQMNRANIERFSEGFTFEDIFGGFLDSHFQENKRERCKQLFEIKFVVGGGH